MEKLPELRVIAHLYNDFGSKFGVPRQSGLCETQGTLVFTEPYRSEDALRGLEGYSHLWLLWIFSEAVRETWSPTVRPPRLGGNRRMGVFATRSPFRPNPIGLSCVRLEGIEPRTPRGPVIRVAGADLMNGTPIVDIKPYLAYADSVPDAAGGFTDSPWETLRVEIPQEIAAKMPPEKLGALRAVLEQDPRPPFHDDPERVYGLSFAGRNVRFTVSGGVLTVRAIEKEEEERR